MLVRRHYRNAGVFFTFLCNYLQNIYTHVRFIVYNGISRIPNPNRYERMTIIMKMITAIVNKKDASEVCRALTEGGFQFTKMATTGGFLLSGNTTLLIGCDDEKVSSVLGIIKSHCAQRMEYAPVAPEMGANGSVYFAQPTQVPVGGATVFVTDVLHFEKM